jgi:hypothetical protein
MIRKVVVILALVAALACGAPEPTPPTPSTPSATTPPAASAESHAHEAPHGGTLVELGEHFGFLEFVLDAAAGRLTVYVLDGGAEQAVRIAQPAMTVTFDAPEAVAGQTLTLAAKANVLTGETVGDTSEFVVTHPALKGQTTFSARVGEVVVKGQTFKDLAVTKAQ